MESERNFFFDFYIPTEEREGKGKRESTIPFFDFHSLAETEARGSESVRGDSRIYCGRAELWACTRGTFSRMRITSLRTSHFGKATRNLSKSNDNATTLTFNSIIGDILHVAVGICRK